ncbi:MAG: hypothetical protein ACK4ON_12625 [Bacteroidia bacterium]
MKKLFFLSITIGFLAVTAQAKIWRVNNNAGVVADATTLTILFDGVNTPPTNPEAANGDTIHVEPSATLYAFPTINKQVVIIGNGYLLNGTGSNAGLQENTLTSRVNGFRFSNGSAGTKIMGITAESSSDFASGYSGNVNITFEKCRFVNIGTLLSFAANVTYSGISFRKCFMGGINNSVPSNTTINNLTIENCIVEGNVFWFKPTNATNFIIRNNTFRLTSSQAIDINNAYVANNLFLTSVNSTGTNVFTSCNVKNNIFTANETAVTQGPLSVNGNNLINQTLASIVVNTGSDDGKYQLAPGSPAINGGVDIAGTKPDCGAFGGTDPYKLSGIPGIPTIYSLTVPASVPLGTPTMNVTISTRNNN